MIKLIIFDFDGIIVEDFGKRNQLVAERGLFNIARLYFGDRTGKEKSICNDLIRQIGFETYNGLSIRPEFVDFFCFFLSLKPYADINTAIFSLNSHYVLDKFLLEAGLSDCIDYIVGIEDVVRPKPNPEGIFKILNYFGVSKDEAVYVGDTFLDVLAGKLAGIKTVKSLEEVKNLLLTGYTDYA